MGSTYPTRRVPAVQNARSPPRVELRQCALPADAEYDFELDTTATLVHELARELHESHQACLYPMAFNRLRKRFLS